ncbi:nitroreductase family protein [Paludisphaera mucosa]|uniref:Nitroreductase family protein n=1 Tax=Paludisphaera mucosa TaxID=3030827 RepID=A0ABT6F853_9BACT|nr:nitroreductase family protein [Paludisphaera mucosa]MDG3003759.1 nitroreductase family protein [Paludisphaera mucosa]
MSDANPNPAAPRPLTVEEAARRRRASPLFDPDLPVEPALLERILGLATLAPSSLNLQPWRFLVVRDAANRRRLQACARNQPKVGQAPVVVVVLGYHHPERTHLEAMLAMQVDAGACTPERAAEIRGRAASSLRDVADRALWATRSTMLAAATLMLAAESLGVASAPMEGFDAEAVRREFGVPDDHSVCCLVALGYAASEKPFPGRFGIEEVCYAEHFGRPWTP